MCACLLGSSLPSVNGNKFTMYYISILLTFFSICSIILGLGQFLFAVYTYLHSRGYVRLSECCSEHLDHVDIDFVARFYIETNRREGNMGHAIFLL